MNNDLISKCSAIAKIVALFPCISNEDAVVIGKAIDAIPAVDAVEVVRCKDCEKRKTKRCAMVQTCINCGWDAWTETDDDDFCSYGERRSDGTIH